MTCGRNDPCPCGSGKKYKKCCLPVDRRAGVGASLAGQERSIAAGAAVWEADIVPLPGGIKGDPASRLAVLLVAADGLIILADALNRPSPEVEPMAEVLASAIFASGEEVGRLPERIVVREPEVAEALARQLGARAGSGDPKRAAMPAVEAGYLPGLDEVAFALVEEATGHAGRCLPSCPETWAGWDLPDETVAALFRLAAAYYRAAPWREATDFDAIEAVMPAGHAWTVVVLGNGGEEFGLGLYSVPGDYWAMFDEVETPEAFEDLEGRILSLTFDAGGEIPRAMRREVATAGWEVASAEAYPQIATVNSPAGGLRRRDREDLAALLAAVPRFVEVHAEELAEGVEVDAWRDEETGIVLSVRPPEDDVVLGSGRVLLEGVEPGCAEGPGAEPEAALLEAQTVWDDPDAFRQREAEVVERYAHHLAEREGLSKAKVQNHESNATLLVDYLASHGVPVRAVHEFDVRDFLFDWYPLKVFEAESHRKTLPGSLVRFFDYLADEEGIVCPWARAILTDRQALLEHWKAAPRGFFWDAAVGDWRADQAEELIIRLLLPDTVLDEEADEDELWWGALMGIDEARLHRELCRRWLLWRDELLRAGVGDSQALARQLVTRQLKWQRSPHPDFEGKSPIEVIREERERQGDRSDLRRTSQPADEPPF